MLKKLIIVLTAVFAMACVAGCGTEKPKDRPDDAILAYAELACFGDDENAAKTGMSKADIQKISDNVNGEFADQSQSFASLKIPADAQEDIMAYLLATIRVQADMKATIKKDSSSEPVVELSYHDVKVNTSSTDPRLTQLMTIAEQGIANGENPAAVPEYVDAVVSVVEDMYDNCITAGAVKTVDVKCKIVKGEDGKTYWAPADANALKDLLK